MVTPPSRVAIPGTRGGAGPIPQAGCDAVRSRRRDATLIIHSQRDYAGARRGLRAVHRATAAELPARFLDFPDEGHRVLKPQNSQLWYETGGRRARQLKSGKKYGGGESEWQVVSEKRVLCAAHNPPFADRPKEWGTRF